MTNDTGKHLGGSGYGIPTVKADPSLFHNYAEVFRREMATVSAFSPKEVEEIHTRIAASEHGFLNQGAYFKEIYERYFRDREWSWPKFEKWKQVFFQRNKWPVSLRNKFSKGNFDKHDLYELLMRTIYGRTMSFDERRRQEKLRITNRKLLIVFKDDQEFIDLALAENPNALTPLFPGDYSMWRIIVPGFS